jgi:hypothetical protein
MVKISKKWIALAFLCMMGLNSSKFAAALPYNIYLNGGIINSYPYTDLYTRMANQYCDFTIKDLITQQKQISMSYTLDNYLHGEKPAEWGGKDERGSLGLIYSITTYKATQTVVWEEMGIAEYSSFARSARVSLKLEHNSINNNFNSKNKYDAIAFHSLNSTPIGEISVDIMPHLSYLGDNSTVPDGSEGVFHVELLNDVDSTPAVNITFKTRPYLSQYQIVAYANVINPASGIKNIPVEIFTGYPNDFNWLNLKVFYDAYNDVYNITLSQYTHDFSTNLVKPLSTILQGNQYRNNTLYNIGHRYAEGNLINKINFKLQSFAINERRSYVYICNLDTKGFSFPATIADVTLKNATISANPDTATGISYQKNSIISCYEPPKYPDGSYSISFTPDYFMNVANRGLLTTWNLAPIWVYALPLVVTSDHQLNVKSIYKVINNLDWPLEERGIFQPAENTEYKMLPNSSFACNFFELNTELSKPYYYYFNSRYTDNILVIEYNTGLYNSGILKSVKIHEKNINRNPDFWFETKYFEGPGKDLTGDNNLPIGPLIGVISGIVVVTLGGIIYYKRKQAF